MLFPEPPAPEARRIGVDRPASISYKTNDRFICVKEHAMMDIGTIFALPLLDSGALNWALPSTGTRLAFLLIALMMVFAFPLFSDAREENIERRAA
jgi:hypothetical protein